MLNNNNNNNTAPMAQVGMVYHFTLSSFGTSLGCSTHRNTPAFEEFYHVSSAPFDQGDARTDE